jgi:tRNA(Ile)-lysidine synthase
MSRNFLRAQALPLLEQRWPAAARVLARAAANSAETAALLDEIARADLALCGKNDGVSLSLTALRQLSTARQRNLVRYWIRQNGFQASSAQHLGRILEQVNRPSRSGLACVDWPDVEVHRYRDQLTILPRMSDPDRGLALPWQPPRAVEIPDTGWRLRAVAAQGAGLSQAHVARAALTLRLRQGGEICQLAGRQHHHKLKKLLQEAGVPPWERERLPLIYADGELAAIGDRWVCAPFAAQPDEPGWRIVLEKSS